ncbi:hypothetical protein C8Q79DRAFT_881628, partial [Trametes meyenii]
RLSEPDRAILRAFAFAVQNNLNETTFQQIPAAFPTEQLPTLKKLRARVAFLSGIDVKRYDCCVDSCMAYTGPLSDLQQCPYCKTSRYDDYGKPRRQFSYLPLKPRLLAHRQHQETAEKMQYRGDYVPDAQGGVSDVFDGTHYRDLCKKRIVVDGQDLGRTFFSDGRDIALGLSTDGFAPWRRRKKT